MTGVVIRDRIGATSDGFDTTGAASLELSVELSLLERVVGSFCAGAVDDLVCFDLKITK